MGALSVIRRHWGFSTLGLIVLVLAVAFWWLFLDARAPKNTDGVYDLAAWRVLVQDDQDTAPNEVRIEFIGGDVAPGWAAEAGNFGAPYILVYTSIQIIGSETTLVLGGAVDRMGAESFAQSDEAWFDADAFDRMTQAMTEADIVTITHEHFDHILGIVRHPDPAAIAPKLLLSERHLTAMARFGRGFTLPESFEGIERWELSAPTRIAPGIVAVPSAGHSPGTIVFYVRTQDGSEYVFIGDIVWAMSNLDTLKTRPRILQYMMFDPNEQRDEVLRQVRALSEMRDAHPDLIIVPSHDRPYLDALVADGALEPGFVLTTETAAVAPNRNP